MRRWFGQHSEVFVAFVLFVVLWGLTVTLTGCCTYDAAEVDEYKAAIVARGEIIERVAVDLGRTFDALERFGQPRFDNLAEGETEEARAAAWFGVVEDGRRLTTAMEGVAVELQRGRDE